MKCSSITPLRRAFAGLALATALLAAPAFANGPLGEHVNDLQSHLGTYSQEVDWLIAQVDAMVARYSDGGVTAAGPAALAEHWEAVDFHAAIESNYMPVYAGIWQGLFAVRKAMESGAPITEVRQQQLLLEQSLWQGLGAVKHAAQMQQRGYAPPPAADAELSAAETFDVIKSELDRVLAKHAEQLPDDAVALVHDTYLTRFEGVEGGLIEADAGLVEALELDFNVTLPKAIQDGASVDAVRTIIQAMQVKLDRAKALTEAAERNRASVF